MPLPPNASYSIHFSFMGLSRKSAYFSRSSSVRLYFASSLALFKAASKVSFSLPEFSSGRTILFTSFFRLFTVIFMSLPPLLRNYTFKKSVPFFHSLVNREIIRLGNGIRRHPGTMAWANLWGSNASGRKPVFPSSMIRSMAPI